MMCIVFWVRKWCHNKFRIILRELRKLRRASLNYRRGTLSKGIVLMHENVRPHVSNRTQDIIGSISWEQFDHSPRVFATKKHLGSQRHDDENNVNTTVLQCLLNQVANSLTMVYKESCSI